MSVVEKLFKLFPKKSAEAPTETSGELSLAMPDASIDPMMVTGALDASNNAVAAAEAESVAQDDSVDALDSVQQAELVSVPLLGRRTIVTHQRILFILLAVSLLVLGSVAVFAVRQ